VATGSRRLRLDAYQDLNLVAHGQLSSLYESGD
jgi:hypothetical protein